jgi:hypothetical protein
MITQRYIIIDEDNLPIRKFYSRIEAKNFIAKRPEMKISVLPKVDVLSKLLDDIGQAPF